MRGAARTACVYFTLGTCLLGGARLFGLRRADSAIPVPWLVPAAVIAALFGFAVHLATVEVHDGAAVMPTAVGFAQGFLVGCVAAEAILVAPVDLAELVAPIIAALSRQTIEDLWLEYRDELTALEVGPLHRIATLVWDARFSLITAMLAGFGRAAAEVGAVIIVGGNIEGFTRTMTTAIALETSKGNLPLAIGLGLVLIAIVVIVNALAWAFRRAAERLSG